MHMHKIKRGKHYMNVYDTANKLASEIRSSEEYIKYKKVITWDG